MRSPHGIASLLACVCVCLGPYNSISTKITSYFLHFLIHSFIISSQTYLELLLFFLFLVNRHNWYRRNFFGHCFSIVLNKTSEKYPADNTKYTYYRWTKNRWVLCTRFAHDKFVHILKNSFELMILHIW